jgi:hypothetical protein
LQTRASDCWGWQSLQTRACDRCISWISPLHHLTISPTKLR